MAGEEMAQADVRPKWPPKPEKTAEDLAAIAFLDELREAKGEQVPEDLPLACIVKVTEYTEVPKANEAYAMVRVVGRDGCSWRMCVRRGSVKTGKNVLFVSSGAALPVEDRYRNAAVCTVKEKVYKYGPGVKARRLLPHVKRNIYRINPGVLYPLADFPELKGKRVGMVVAVRLGIDDAEEMKIRQSLPRSQLPSPQDAAMAQAKKMLKRLRELARLGVKPNFQDCN
ncbi:MAG: hypothetical protein IKO72_10080 [Kiritimatiellae bacterium]|nr:hypothetical protein [Kiritimatiellia bacterium]